MSPQNNEPAPASAPLLGRTPEQMIAQLTEMATDYAKIIAWLMGEEGAWTQCPSDGIYWWRRELRERHAKLIQKQATITAATIQPLVREASDSRPAATEAGAAVNYMHVVEGSRRSYCRVKDCEAFTWANVEYGYCPDHLIDHLQGHDLQGKSFPVLPHDLPSTRARRIWDEWAGRKIEHCDRALVALVDLLDGQAEPLHPISWQVELSAAKAALCVEPKYTQTTRCGGCGHRWLGPAVGVGVFCGDCWREFQALRAVAQPVAAPPLGGAPQEFKRCGNCKIVLPESSSERLCPRCFEQRKAIKALLDQRSDDRIKAFGAIQDLWEPLDAASRPVRTPDQPDQEQNDEAKSKDAEPTQATADASPLTPASQADQAALSPAREAWYRGQMEKLAAEVDMLRGVGCLKDGDGPCGVCIKCLRQRAEQEEAKIVAIVEKITGLLNHRTVSTEHIVRDRKEGTKHYGHNPSWIKMVEIVDIKESLT